MANMFGALSQIPQVMFFTRTGIYNLNAIRAIQVLIQMVERASDVISSLEQFLYKMRNTGQSQVSSLKFKLLLLWALWNINSYNINWIETSKINQFYNVHSNVFKANCNRLIRAISQKCFEAEKNMFSKRLGWLRRNRGFVIFQILKLGRLLKKSVYHENEFYFYLK